MPLVKHEGKQGVKHGAKHGIKCEINQAEAFAVVFVLPVFRLDL